jgi:hypothetical protein
MEKKWTGWHSFGLMAILVAIALFGLLIPVNQILLSWLLTLVALTVFAMLAGHGITGRFWFGWLINEQYRMSLSRLQMFLWMIVVLSAFLTAALANIRMGYSEKAVAIAIPEYVWLAMGISTTALVGSPLILEGKKEKPTNQAEAEKTLVELNILDEPPVYPDMSDIAEDPQAMAYAENNYQIKENIYEVKAKTKVAEHTSGQLFRNTKPDDAKLTDLVSGEEVGNADILDLSRLQNLFFTLIIVGSYAAALGTLLVNSSGAIEKFPELGASQVALLGISTAGFLGAKAVDKQPDGE